MQIKFCSKCNVILKPANKDGKNCLVCPRCGETEELHGDLISKSEGIEKEKLGSGVAEKKDFSGYDFKCKKCGNDKCRVIDLGMMVGDEDWIYLLQCTKCDYGERIGDWC